MEQRGNEWLMLHGRTLVQAQVLWGILIILLLGMFIAAFPPYFAFLQTTCINPNNCYGVPTAAHVQTLKAVGLSLRDYAWFNVIFAVVEELICLVLGLVIFWRKSSEPMAWLASLALIFIGTSNIWYTFLGEHSPWPIAGRLFDDVAFILLLLFFALFPTGRFVPRWTRVLPIIYAIYGLLPLLFPHVLHIVGFGIGTVIWVGSIISIAAAQVYRYRKVSTLLERQQTKWVVLGLTTTVLIAIGSELLAMLFPPLGQPGSFYTLFLSDISTGCVILIPISVALAILRSRLWDIDVIINRTLVYGTLTVLLTLVYFGLVIGLEALVRTFTGQEAQSQVVIVASTLAIAALFQPLRHRIQILIDRRFYRRKYDAARTLAAFSATLRNEVDLHQLREQLVTIVEETMQPAHVSLWLRTDKQQRKPHTDG
jgi:hypothetical protein